MTDRIATLQTDQISAHLNTGLGWFFLTEDIKIRVKLAYFPLHFHRRVSMLCLRSLRLAATSSGGTSASTTQEIINLIPYSKVNLKYIWICIKLCSVSYIFMSNMNTLNHSLCLFRNTAKYSRANVRKENTPTLFRRR